MSGKRHPATEAAARLVTERGLSVTEAARRKAVHVTSVRRALRAAGVPPLKGGKPRKAKRKQT